MLKLLKKYRKECVLAPTFKLLEACFDLTVPIVVAAVIDNGINGDGGSSYIIKMVFILVALAAVGMAVATAAQYFAAKAAVGFSGDVREELFKKIQTFSYSELDSLGTSSMITRMTSDVNQLQTGINLFLRLFLRAPVIVFGAMIMAFVINAHIALIFVVAIALLFAVVYGVMFLTVPLYKKSQADLDSLLLLTRENLDGARVIRAFAAEEREIADFDKKNAALTKMQYFVGKISALMNPLTYMIINFAVIALIYFGSRQIDGGIILQGSLVALYSYMAQILVELIKFANLIVTMSKTAASKKRIDEIMRIEPERTGSDISDISQKIGDAAVSFDNVSLRYGTGGDDVLSNISFDVRRGETVGIIGGTGSGKTSLINLIPHFYDATGGTVYVYGIPVERYDSQTLLQKIGIVPQKAVLFKGTVRDNIKWGNENASDDEIIDAIKLAQGYDIIEKSGGLDREIEQDAKNLSGGQRQRLTIARALIKKPEILILDDSASALDYATDAALRRAIKTVDATVFIVSQRASAVMGADKIIVMNDGEICGIGTHDELIRSCPTYREIYFSQYPEKEADA